MGAQIAPHSYFLAEHAYCVESPDGAILLDIRSGTYLALDVSNLATLRARILDWPVYALKISEATCANPLTEPLICELVSRGLVTIQRPERPRPRHAVPTASVMPSDRKPPSDGFTLRHQLRFFSAVLHVVLRYRRHRIAPFLGWLRDAQRGFDCSDAPTPADRADLLATFSRMRVWFYTARDQCLLDSMILSVFLTKSRVPCRFVIGVATKPFSAHAWVEIGDAVANDVIDHAQDYLPILWTE